MCCLVLCAALTGCSAEDKNPPPKQAVKQREVAPDIFTLRLDTSKGIVDVEMHRDWSPSGVDHVYKLVQTGYYDGNRIYRVTQRYAQFGVNGDPGTSRLWSTIQIAADPVKQSNVKGMLTYAQTDAGSRTTQLFFNLKDNKDLDKTFAPIGKVITGMDAVASFYPGYGDLPPRGLGPDPAKLQQQGNSYLDAQFPRLDFIRKATIR
jgi:peptidyl-prolyl cis-trans isomerase A (cyclophilin A)